MVAVSGLTSQSSPRKGSSMSHSDELPSLQLLIKVLEFASRKHSQQRRKDVEASPYINHPIAVLSILAVEAGIGDMNVLCAALLHDTIEDTITSEAELADRFGRAIAGIVREVTDDKSLPKGERKRLQIEHATHLSEAAGRVKIADKIANLRDVADCPPVDWSVERRLEYFDWAKAVVDRVRLAPEPLRLLFDRAYARRPMG